MGINDIKEIFKNKKTAEIYFHQDLDGVTTALAMRDYIKTQYSVETVDFHIIQYGELEFVIQNAKEGNVPIVVDFAHSKPMFTIATDHHDSQIGGEDSKSTYYKPARSNVETVSGEISPNDIFTNTDLKLIQMVDSADYLRNNIEIDDIQNSIFKYDKTKSPSYNRFIMGLVVNRLLLAYKNKDITIESLDGSTIHKDRNLLECLVMDSEPSLYSMFNNLRHYIRNAKVSDKLGRLATEKEIAENLANYVKRMKNYRYSENPNGDVFDVNKSEILVLSRINNKRSNELPQISKSIGISERDINLVIESLMDKKYLFKNYKQNKYFIGNLGRKVLNTEKNKKGVYLDKDGIIMQYGSANMFKPGSYDRFTAFKNNPTSNFLCMVWPMGLIQISCNPFKKMEIEDINLSDISNEILDKHKESLMDIKIPISDIKKEYETSWKWKKMVKKKGEDFDSIGFKYVDLKAFYGNCICNNNGELNENELKNLMSIDYDKLSKDQLNKLSPYYVTLWEMIIRNSGGHKCITNISSLNFLKYDKDGMGRNYSTSRQNDIMKLLAKDIVLSLKDKLKNNKLKV